MWVTDLSGRLAVEVAEWTAEGRFADRPPRSTIPHSPIPKARGTVRRANNFVATGVAFESDAADVSAMADTCRCLHRQPTSIRAPPSRRGQGERYSRRSRANRLEALARLARRSRMRSPSRFGPPISSSSRKTRVILLEAAGAEWGRSRAIRVPGTTCPYRSLLTRVLEHEDNPLGGGPTDL